MEEDRQTSAVVQAIVTFGLGGIFAYYYWERLEGVSRGMVILFGLIAALSISQGTWTTNARELRRAARHNRREAYGQVRQWARKVSGPDPRKQD